MMTHVQSWRCTGWVLAILIGAVLGGECLAEQSLTLQGASPKLILDDNAGTFQKWTLYGSELGFDIGNDTAGSFPLRIVSGAESDSIRIGFDGNVGFGEGNPQAPIHVLKDAQGATAEVLARFSVADDTVGALTISNNSAGNGVFIPKIVGRSASQNAAMVFEAIITNDVGPSPAIVYNAALGAGGPLDTRPLVVYRNNSVAKVTIAANGNVIGANFVSFSSRELKDKITDLPSDKASAALRQLNPVEFVYKDDETADPRIGFIAEDVPDLIAEPDRKSVPVMDVLALVTRVVKDQQKTIDEQQKTIEQLQRRLEAVEKR